MSHSNYLVTEICILGPDRVGSTYFCDLLNQLPNVMSTNPEYEIFKRSELPDTKRHAKAFTYFYERLINQTTPKQIQKKKIPDYRDPKYMRMYINSWKKLAHQKDKEFFLYKILYHQITPEQLQTFIKQAPSNTIYIVLTRNLLDMYISHRKAKILHTWHQVDTSDIKITFNRPIRFKDWISPRKKWLTHIQKLFNQPATTTNQPTTTNPTTSQPTLTHFDYDELHENPDLTTDKEKLSYILSMIKQSSPHQYNLTIPDHKKKMKSKIIKQDDSNHYADKVVNLMEMVNYFQNNPMDLELKNIFERILDQEDD